MDKTTILLQTTGMTIAEGFPGQRMIVLPRSRLQLALASPGTAHLVVSDCGYFPEARAHGRTRLSPIDEAIILICTRGSGWCRINDGVVHPVHAGQAVIVPPGVPHEYGASQTQPWTLWWAHLAGNDLAAFLQSADMTETSPVRVLSNVYAPVALIEEIIRWYDRDLSTTSLLAASGAAWHLLTKLATMRRAADPRAEAIESARQFIRDNLDQTITVNKLASLARLSPSHFSALFRSQTGQAPLNFQMQLRMAKARELLDTSELAIARIAEQCGYQDPYYFSRIFKKTHSISPARYRQQRNE